MKQVLQNPSGTVVRNVPPPPCLPTHVLVQNEFSVISSGTERSVVEEAQQSIVSRVKDRPELALKAVDRVRRDGIRGTRQLLRERASLENASGYSSAGRVIEVGSNVRGFEVGQRVACAGAAHAHHAEIVSVPANLCARVPDEVPMTAAALTTIAAIALHGVRLAEAQLGDRAAVIGCGLVGQIACRLLNAAGLFVIALDLDPTRVRDAIAAGAAYGTDVSDDVAGAVKQVTDGRGVDHVLITAAATTNHPLLLASEIARDRGNVVLVGDARIDIPRHTLFEKELSLRVSRSYGPGRYDPEYEERGLDYPIGYVRWTEQRNMASILDLQARGALTLHDLIEEVVPIERAGEAYARLAGPPETRPHGAIAFAYDSSSNGSPVLKPPTPTRTARTAGTVRVGLIGPGGFATGVLVPALRAAGAELAVVAGGSGPSAESMARKAGFERFAENEDALIADETVDAVVIATRHGSHARLVRACLEAGKHVFCEKPLALTPGELEAVLGAARGAERVLMVGLNRRFSPHAIAARDFAYRPGPLTCVYRVSAGQIEPNSWIHDLEQGGGRIIGEGCHFLDTLAFVTGSPISGVHARGFGAAQLPLQAWDNVMVTVSFANGSVGTLAYVAEGAPGVGKERLEVFSGTRTAILDDYRSLELHGDGPKPRRTRLREQDKGHASEVAAFLAGVRDGRHPIPVDEIANVHLACFATVDSLRTGRAVAVPPAPGESGD